MTGLLNASFEDTNIEGPAGNALHWTLLSNNFADPGVAYYDIAALSAGPRRGEHFEENWSLNETDLRAFAPADLQNAFFTTLLVSVDKLIEDFEELWSSNDQDVAEYAFTEAAPLRGTIVESKRSASVPLAIADNTDYAGGFADYLTVATSDASQVILRLVIAHSRMADLMVRLDADSVVGADGNIWDHQADATGTGIDIELDVTNTLGTPPTDGSWLLSGNDNVATNYGTILEWGLDLYGPHIYVESFELNWGPTGYLQTIDDVPYVSAGIDGFEGWGATVFDFSGVGSAYMTLETPGGPSTVESFEYVNFALPCQVNDLALHRLFAPNHNYVIDDLVHFSTDAGGILPSGIAEGLDYYVTSAIGDNIFLVDVVSAGGGGTSFDPVTVGFAPFYVAKTKTLWWNEALPDLARTRNRTHGSS